MRGLELLFKIEKQNLASKSDALVLATHCFLVNDGFRCVGLGDKVMTRFVYMYLSK